MSLTSHLKNSRSPVYRFMREQFPHTRGFVRTVNKEMKGSTTISPKEQVDLGIVGQAIDYRIRYYFAVTSPERLVAYKGAGVLREKAFAREGEGLVTASMVSPAALYEDLDVLHERIDMAGRTTDEFFHALSSFLERVRPAGRRLRRDEEDRLLRYCVVLACFEQIYRIAVHPRNPLFTSVRTNVPALLQIADDAMLDDLRALSWAFYDKHSALLSGDREAILNPTFDGSPDVGGADADLILDGCLIDIKTTVAPKLTNNMLYQLLGYVLLDYSDQYRIREVGIYFARQQRLLRWPLDGLLRDLTSGGNAPFLG